MGHAFIHTFANFFAGKGAGHMDNILNLFPSAKRFPRRQLSPLDMQTSKNMVSLWTRFAKYGWVLTLYWMLLLIRDNACFSFLKIELLLCGMMLQIFIDAMFYFLKIWLPKFWNFGEQIMDSKFSRNLQHTRRFVSSQNLTSKIESWHGWLMLLVDTEKILYELIFALFLEEKYGISSQNTYY